VIAHADGVIDGSLAQKWHHGRFFSSRVPADLNWHDRLALCARTLWLARLCAASVTFRGGGRLRVGGACQARWCPTAGDGKTEAGIVQRTRWVRAHLPIDAARDGTPTARDQPPTASRAFARAGRRRRRENVGGADARRCGRTSPNRTRTTPRRHPRVSHEARRFRRRRASPPRATPARRSVSPLFLLPSFAFFRMFILILTDAPRRRDDARTRTRTRTQAT
jgi:hypothetical protein